MIETLAFIGLPGPWEMAIVGLVAVLLFGKRLPGVARSVGSSFVEFKRGLSGVGRELNECRDAARDADRAIREEVDQSC